MNQEELNKEIMRLKKENKFNTGIILVQLIVLFAVGALTIYIRLKG